MTEQDKINDDALDIIFAAETEEVKEEEKHQEETKEVEEPTEISETQEVETEETQKLNPVDPAFQKVLAKAATGIYNKGVPWGYNMFFSEKLKAKTLFDLKEEKDELKIIESCTFVIIKRAMEKFELTEEDEIGFAVMTILAVTTAKLATAPKVAPPAPKIKGEAQVYQVEEVKRETRGRKKKVENE